MQHSSTDYLDEYIAKMTSRGDIHKTLRLSTKPLDCPHLTNSSTKVKIFHKLSPIIVSTHKKLKITEENGNVNSPFSFKDCFLVPCAVVSTGVREWVTLGKFECLRGMDFVLGDVCKRKP
jgi:hypothetical protein